MPEIKPEQPEGLQAGAEFYEAKQARESEAKPRSFSTEAERDAMTDQTAKILKFKPKEQQVETSEVHHEAVIPLPNEIKTDVEKREKINSMLGSKTSGYEQTETLRQLMDTDKAA